MEVVIYLKPSYPSIRFKLKKHPKYRLFHLNTASGSLNVTVCRYAEDTQEPFPLSDWPLRPHEETPRQTGSSFDALSVNTPGFSRSTTRINLLQH
jgi:hypothetical protein